MLAVKFPGLMERFSREPLIEISRSLEGKIPGIEFHWYKSNAPLSTYSKPSDAIPSPPEEANHVVARLGGKDVFVAYSIKSGFGKFFFYDENISQNHYEIVSSTLKKHGFKVPGKGNKMAFALSIAHLGLMFLVCGFCFFAGLFVSMTFLVYFLFIGFFFVITLVGLVLVLLKHYKAGMIVLIIAMILTIPSGLLQYPLINYAQGQSSKPKNSNWAC